MPSDEWNEESAVVLYVIVFQTEEAYLLTELSEVSVVLTLVSRVCFK